MQPGVILALCLFAASTAQGQIQVEIKLRRFQYVAYEPVLATLTITNSAGRDVELRDAGGQHWFGFELNGGEGQSISPSIPPESGPTLNIEAGKTASRKIDLTPIYPVHDPGTYRVRANI